MNAPVVSPTFDPAFFGEPSRASLVSQQSTGVGAAINYYGVRDTHAMQLSFTSNPTSVICGLQLSLDAITWYTAATFSILAGNGSGDIVVVSNVPALFSRANLTTLAGGTSPAVTAVILAK